MINQIRQLAKVGIHTDMDPAEKRVVQLLNRICLLAIGIFSVFSLIPNLIMHHWISIISDIINLAAFSLCLYFNWKKKFTLSKNYVAIYGAIIIPLVNMGMGPEGFPYANYIGMVIMPALIFKRLSTIYKYYIFNVLTFVGVIYYHAHYPPFIPFEEDSIMAARILNSFINIFIIGFFLTLFYKGLQREYEKTVSKKNQLLSEQHQELLQAHEELKIAQGRLIQSEKMASLGQLTAGLAHEINNPINFVSGSIGPLKRDIQDLKELLPPSQNGSDSDEILDEISMLLKNMESGTSRVKQIVTDLRSFSRLNENARKPVNLHEGLDATLGLLTHLSMNRIQIIRNYGEIPMVTCDPAEINQVFLHLLNNAIESIAEKGEIVLTTQKQSDYVWIEIQDSGKGISEKHLPLIFDPFFTTKEIGKGKGLGLSTAYGIVKNHGGEIEVESQLEKGTRVVVHLPIEG